MRQALWRPGWAPTGKGRLLFLRALRARLAETAGLADDFYAPWREIQPFDGMLFLVGPGPAAEAEPAGSWWPGLDLDGRLLLAGMLLRTAAAFERRGVRLGPVRPECILRAGGGWRLEDPIVADLAAPFRPDWPVHSRLNFIPPEEANGGGAIPAGDRFALGATLYWLFAGRLPFADEDERYIIARSRSQEPLDPRYYLPPLPGRAAETVLSLLAREPSRRPAPSWCADAFVPGAREPGSQLRWCRRRANLPIRHRPRGTRRTIPAAALGLTFLAFLAVPTIFLPRRREPPPPDLAQAARTVRRLYEARNNGDYAAMTALTSSGLVLDGPLPPNTAVWREVIRLTIRPGPAPGQARAAVGLRVSSFRRGVVRRWSDEERMTLKARRGRWVVTGISPQGDRSGQRAE